MSRDYSAAVAGAVRSALEEDDWRFSFDEDKGLFRFSLTMKSRLKNVSYMIIIGKEDYTVYGTSPIGGETEDPAMMSEMAEFICRANYSNVAANFELDMRDGEIRCKSYSDCDSIIPSRKMIINSLSFVQLMFQKYGDGIMDITCNGLSGQKAFEKCEQKARGGHGA